MVIQPHRAELVDQHGALAELRLLDPVVEQRCLAAAEKAGQQGHRDTGILHIGHVRSLPVGKQVAEPAVLKAAVGVELGF